MTVLPPMVDFTRAGYSVLVRAILARGYEIRDYADADPAARHLILRHDIDQSIQAALDIARLEAERGWAAHYFVLLRTEMYNPFSADSLRDLKEILSLGHRIGLHLDAALYPENAEALDKAAAGECRILEEMLDCPVADISFHRPARRLLDSSRDLAGRRHASQKRFFSDMGYCSDSRGLWRFGPPLDHAAIAEGRALQLLTHPIWWSREEAVTPFERLEDFAMAHDRSFRDQLAANCLPYAQGRKEASS